MRYSVSKKKIQIERKRKTGQRRALGRTEVLWQVTQESSLNSEFLSPVRREPKLQGAMSNLWHIKLLKRWAWRLFIAVHTQQNAVCFKSCLELQETNKLKWRKQLGEITTSRMNVTTDTSGQYLKAAGDTTILSESHYGAGLIHTRRLLPTFVLFYPNIRKVVPDGWQRGLASSRKHFACAPNMEAEVLSEWWWVSTSACDYPEGLEGQHEARDGQAQ